MYPMNIQVYKLNITVMASITKGLHFVALFSKRLKKVKSLKFAKFKVYNSFKNRSKFKHKIDL